MATDRWSDRLDRAVAALTADRRRRVARADVLRTVAPSVYNQIRRSARFEALHGLWGLSANRDELADAQIVAPSIVRLIAELSGLDFDGAAFHAGYQHTYAYLFSVLETPYGLKRDRWIRSTLDDLFGFSAPTIRIHPRKGTLLLNLTWLLGSLVFDRNSEARTALDTFRSTVPEQVARFHRRSPRRARIIERPSRTPFEIITDIIELKTGDLLIYSLRDRDGGEHRLVTTFPISKAVKNELLAAERFAPTRRDLELRFNAVAPALGKGPMRGTRILASVPHKASG